jgi:putative transposase
MPRNDFVALVEGTSVSVSYVLIVYRDKQALQEETGQSIEIHQSKYLNNFVEQGHRAIKRIIRSMLDFKAFRPAGIILQGIKLMHRVKKGQLVSDYGQDLSVAGQFYSLAA